MSGWLFVCLVLFFFWLFLLLCFFILLLVLSTYSLVGFFFLSIFSILYFSLFFLRRLFTYPFWAPSFSINNCYRPFSSSLSASSSISCLFSRFLWIWYKYPFAHKWAEDTPLHVHSCTHAHSYARIPNDQCSIAFVLVATHIHTRMHTHKHTYIHSQTSRRAPQIYTVAVYRLDQPECPVGNNYGPRL